MEFGVHLPQIEWTDERVSLERLIAVATTAQRLGFGTITANDHLVYGRPWLDGPTALAAIMAAAPMVKLMTSVSLPVVRGPYALAKSLAAIDLLSGGRLDAGLGPGSSQADYALLGIPFDERWTRFDEAVAAMRALWDADGPPFAGRFYDTTGITQAPPPARPKGPPVWIGSWGSAAGLRRVARLGDGWLASGYNTTPHDFATTRAALDELLAAGGRDPSTFPSTLATAWLYVTTDAAKERAVVAALSQMLRRSEDEVRTRLPIGSPDRCVDLLARYRAVGVGRVLVWPVGDELEQIERLAADVIPQVASAG